MWLAFIIIWFVFGIICYALAEKKGKNKTIAFGMGFILGIFAVAYYAFCSGSHEYRLKKAKQEAEIMKARIGK